MNAALLSMLAKKIPPSVTKSVSRKGLVFRKQSPHIFFGVGLAGSVASTVLACKATLKLGDTLDEIQKDVSQVRDLKKDIDEGTHTNYPSEQLSRDYIYVYSKAGLKLAKLYSPSLVVGVLSVTAMTSSHVQLARRNTALMAAYAAVQKAYDDYRERVQDEVGRERELDLYHAAKNRTNKNELGQKEEFKAADPNSWSPYAKFFDEGSTQWKKDPELNRLYVQVQQNYANHLLHARGHVFLNEVYDMLGIDRSKAGAVVGWVIGEDGDNFIDFGIFEASNSRFVNGWERSILLDFNVDGVIYDKI